MPRFVPSVVVITSMSPTLRHLRDAYGRLARFERHSGSKLNSLRRLIQFGCFLLHRF
ncbi:MAG: hypothetical protein LH654_14555 [Thermoleophilia bacterium]|nr:hypothetical protein [Thermoleophilia bacterium]